MCCAAFRLKFQLGFSERSSRGFWGSTPGDAPVGLPWPGSFALKAPASYAQKGPRSKIKSMNEVIRMGIKMRKRGGEERFHILSSSFTFLLLMPAQETRLRIASPTQAVFSVGGVDWLPSPCHIHEDSLCLIYPCRLVSSTFCVDRKPCCVIPSVYGGNCRAARDVMCDFRWRV
jgi:hypothetical protein